MSKREYLEKRNALIPKASRHADEVVGKGRQKGETRERWAERWNLCYHTEMNRLWNIEKNRVRRVKR